MDTTIESLDVSAFVIPTATHESDGTLEWDSTTLVLVEVSGDTVDALADAVIKSIPRTCVNSFRRHRFAHDTHLSSLIRSPQKMSQKEIRPDADEYATTLISISSGALP